MKKYLSILAISAMASSAFAQGTIAFANNNSSLVKVGNSPTDPAAVALASPGYAQLFAAPAGTAFTPWAAGMSGAQFLAANSAFHFYGNPAPINPSAAGRFNGSTVTNTAIAAGAGMEAAIVAWQGNYSSFDAAVAAGAAVGASGKVTFASTGNPIASPPTPAATLVSATGLGPTIVSGVPEPTSLALIGLGAAAMLVMRRRK